VIKNYRRSCPDKAKPFVRGGQKVTGLIRKMAELPKDAPLVCSAFYLIEGCKCWMLSEEHSGKEEYL